MNSSNDNHDEQQNGKTEKDQVIISFDDHESQSPKKRSESLKLPPRDTDSSIINDKRHGSSFIGTKRPSLVANNSSSRSMLWVSVCLEEMGVKIEPSKVEKMVQSDAHEHSRDFIVETILQNEFEKTNSPNVEEEKSVIQIPVNSESMIELDGSFYSPSYWDTDIRPIPTDDKLCGVCKKKLEDDLDFIKIFSCADKFCQSCILEKFENKIKSGDDIETFVCPQENCGRPILADKFAKFVPVVDFKDIEDLEIGTCSICFDEIKGNEDLLKIFECQTHLFCYDCTLNYLKESINNRKVLDIKCPDTNCESHVDDNKMRNLIPSYIFSRYKRYKRNAQIERDPDLRWCTRPGCEKVVKGVNNNLKACCECGQLTCIGCGNPWHNNKTCEEALEAEYKLFIKQKDIQFCPYCKSKVEKSEGCNHMTCPICTYEWCWLCGGECPSNHFDIFNPFGCPGLMTGDNSRKKWSKCKLRTYKLLYILLMILLLPLAPVAAIIAAILLPNILCNSYFNNSDFRPPKRFFLRTLLVILGVILLPLTIVLGIISAIAPGTCCLVMYLQERRRVREEAHLRRLDIVSRRSGNPPTADLEDIEEKRKIENISNRLVLSQPLLGDITGGIYLP